MSKLNFKQILKNNWIHILAFAMFFIATLLYFQPQFSGYGLKQHDAEQYRGMSNEIQYHRNTHGEEALWTNSMFGGMPAYQISAQFPGNWMSSVAQMFHLWMASPAGRFITYLLGFYIMLLCMKVDPKLAILGAFAFAFSSYFIIILQAGHNTKAQAIGFAPMVLGAFYVAYRRSFKWGLLLSALFMSLELYSNHVQITYYLGILMVFLGISELVRFIKAKELLKFLKISAGLILVYLFAAGINYGRLSLTNDYAKHTIRGGNDITIRVDGTSSETNQTSGLDRDYVTQWSYGIDESLTLISPNIKGGASSALSNSQFSDLLRDPEIRREASLVANNNVYWGDQPFTSGPVYLGIIVFYLALLGMIYLRDPRKWALFVGGVLALMLSWGHNFMGLTDFFLDYIPFYNKFRAVTIILTVVELVVPILAVLFLDKLFKKKDEIKKNLKPLYIATGGLFVLLLTLTYTGLGDGYLSKQENDFLITYPDQVKAQLAQEDPEVLLQNNIDINNPDHIQQVVAQQMEMVDQQFTALSTVRKSIYQSSMWRSILFLVIGAGLVGIFLFSNVKKGYIIAGLSLFIIVDLVNVDLNYLNNRKSNNRNYDHWVEQDKKDFPFAITNADKQVLEMELAENPSLQDVIDAVEVDKKNRRKKVSNNELWSNKMQTLGANTNYRVYEPALGFNNSRASYFHKALNGYHGAKLRRIQNVKDFHIDYNNMEVINMLNVKYFLQNDEAVRNYGALGNVWLVKELNVQESPNKELLSLGTLFEIEAKGGNNLIVNDELKDKDVVSGNERIVLFKEDSLIIDFTQVKRNAINASYVEDINGNRNWLPTSELSKDSLDSFQELLSAKVIHKFDPRNEAIIGEEEAQSISSLQFSGEGNVSMTSYLPNKMTYQVDVSDNQFAVFSEIYYPDGWNVYANDEKLEIHRVDYLLRGVELPAGNYELTMKFEEPKFKLANNMGRAGSLILFILMGGFFVKDFVLDKKEEKDKKED